MMGYCEVCSKEVLTKVISKKEVFTVFGEKINIDTNVLVCDECGEELFDEELDSASLIKAYNEYRKIHKLLFPDEIKRIREQYGLSQRSFSKILNWGDKTICRYENGSVQDRAHNSLLLFLRDPENMRTYLTDNEVSITEKQKNKILDSIERIENDKKYRFGRHFFDMLFSYKPSEESGFKDFDYDKFCAMVLFFTNKPGELLKTKLIKLLNYSDMLFYKEKGVSISGLKYVHYPYGPVPIEFDFLIGKLAADNIAHFEIEYDIYEKHKVVPDCEFPQNVLSEIEYEILDRVYNRFKDMGSKEISDYSHKEKGYNETKPGEVISYKYANDISI